MIEAFFLAATRQLSTFNSAQVQPDRRNIVDRMTTVQRAGTHHKWHSFG